MILDLQSIRGDLPTTQKYTWSQQFRYQIIKASQSYKKNISYPQKKISDQSAIKIINQIACKQQTMPFNKLIQVNLNSFYQYEHYNNYIPINHRLYFDQNQLERQYQVLTKAYQKNYQLFSIRFAEEIKKNLQRLYRFRYQTCKKYNYTLSITEGLQRYANLLSFGTTTLLNFPDMHTAIQKICSYRKYFSTQSTKVKKNISVTVDNNQFISLSSISFTMKALYCSVCFIYDCSIHRENPQKHKYVSEKALVSKDQHLSQCIEMLSFKNSSCLNGNMKMCGKDCFLKMNRTENGGNQNKKMVYLSNLSKSIIEMGINQFSYCPCKIKILFDSSVSCQQIYLYLKNEHRAQSKIENKLYLSEGQMLEDEISYSTKMKSSNILSIISREKRKNCRKYQKKIICKNQNKKSDFNSICFHHMLNRERVQPNCQQCQCKDRGYCLPSCLCTQSCKLLKRGCRCTKGQCKGFSCICYKNNVECIPQVCGIYCWGRESCCGNRQIQKVKKRKLRVGISKIEGAGLGLYTAQFISKGSLVILYLGEKIDQISIQLRQTLRRNNSFYNFKCENTYIDSRFIGNQSRFINHSRLNANLIVRQVESLSETWIGFYASRNIHRQEQLYFDYDGDGQLSRNHSQKYPFINEQGDGKKN